jgi:membrane protein YqaA with SNARE-associated domain
MDEVSLLGNGEEEAAALAELFWVINAGLLLAAITLSSSTSLPSAAKTFFTAAALETESSSLAAVTAADVMTLVGETLSSVLTSFLQSASAELSSPNAHSLLQLSESP